MSLLGPHIWLPFLLASMTPPLLQHGGFITGEVRDRSGGAIAGAEVRVQNQDTGVRQKVFCDANGQYSTSELAEGAYQVTTRSDGFRTVTHDVTLARGKTIRADFVLELLPFPPQEITVEASPNSEDPTATPLVVSVTSKIGSPPANGTDVHAVLGMMPGVTLTPASIGAGGQFTSNGQRPNANSFFVDGVSGNVGIGIISVPGAFPGGTLPGMTTIGGMQSLASGEERQRTELHSADFAAQFGDRPGARVSIETKAGTEQFHGSLFGYIRPRELNSLDWFARGAGQDLPTALLDGWAARAGGPLGNKKTFLFVSTERTNVHDGALEAIPVASPAAQFAGGEQYQQLFNAFPQPTGRALTVNESLGYSPLQKAAALTNYSLRLDQSLGGHVQFFARYSNVPSVSTSIELGTAYSVFHWTSATAGLNLAGGKFTGEVRFNYTDVSATAEHGPLDTPAVNSLSQYLANYLSSAPGGFNPSWQITQVAIAGVGQTISGKAGESGQRQLTGTYVVARHGGLTDLKFGGDYTKLVPSYSLNQTLSIVSSGIDPLLAGVPLGVTNASFSGPLETTQRSSLFAQETLHINARLNVLLGVRWEFTPASFSGFHSYAPSQYPYLGFWEGLNSNPRQVGSNYNPLGSNWPMRYGQVAPRAGLSYHLRSPDLVLRFGGGLFYDTGLGSIIANANPLTLWEYAPTLSIPATSGDVLNQAGPPVLSLPRVWEWRASAEKTVWKGSLFALSYLGSAGHRLLENEASITPQTGVLETLVFASNGRSDYEALLAEFRADVTRHMHVFASYTWGHSIDVGSSDTAPLLVLDASDAARDRGSSGFDVRQLFTASTGYRLTASQVPPRLSALLAGWTLSSTFQARTGFPFDVTTVDRSIGLGFENSGRPDLVPGEPLWNSNSGVPGGRELNPAAFSTPAAGLVNGTLGRNVLTGSGLFQIDANLRREFRLYERLSMEASVSAFNLLNHPTFSNPVSYLGSALFGQSTSTANLMLGSGSPITGSTPLFQAGGPRTVELGLRFTF